MTDTYYQKILAGLANLDRWQDLEKAVIDLLSDVYPSLVPIHGGQDAGMDGAIADGEGEAYSLITTTANSVIRNVTRNLKSYRSHGGERDKAVVATSTAMTPPQRRNLEQRVRDLGFVLVQLHEQRDLANRLRRESRWAKQLLGVTGQPPALSTVPVTAWPLLEIELIGRRADLQWLANTTGDRLLVGQPGSGKTYLLYNLVLRNGAFFLASSDESAIAEAVLEFEPELIIVDDAHSDPEMLDRLRRLRLDIHADYALIASTWPGSEDVVAAHLGISEDNTKIHRLELLTRSEVIEVLRRVGVTLPSHDRFFHMLVDHSSNKPGLAVLLGSLWLRGEYKGVLSGEAIRASLIPSLTGILGHDPSLLLACFALGGDRGVDQEIVRRFLGLSFHDFHKQIVQASQGGVLWVRSEGRLVVEPEPLRWAVIDRVFFRGPASPFRYKQLLIKLPDQSSALKTLVLAAAHEVPVPRRDLQEYLAEVGRPAPWGAYARLGMQEAEWVLENYPGSLESIAWDLIRELPEKTIRLLVQVASEAKGPLHSSPRHPFRILQDWLQEIPDYRLYVDPQGESLWRRKLVVDEAQRLFPSPQHHQEALRAALIALSPALEQSSDSATRDSVVLQHGVLAPDAVPAMTDLWETVRRALLDQPERHLTREVWASIENVLYDWTYPDAFGKSLSQEQLAKYRTLGCQIVTDLKPAASNHPGLALALRVWAKRLELCLDIYVDSDFQVLFPPDVSDPEADLQVEMEAQKERARQLAEVWALESPTEVSQRLSFFELESSRYLGDRLGYHTRPMFFTTLAGAVDSPHKWFRAFLDQRIDGRWVGYFLDYAVSDQRSAGDYVSLCLDDEDYFWLGAKLVLRSEEISDVVRETVLTRASNDLLAAIAFGGELPSNSLLRLFQHQSESVVASAVAGEWLADPRGTVRRNVEGAWRNAVLRIGESGNADELATPPVGYWLKAILSTNSELAVEWLKARLEADGRGGVPRNDGLFSAAVRALDTQGRVEILEHVQSNQLARYVISFLAQESTEVYRQLLARDDLSGYHLVPLEGRVPDEGWKELAALALEHGYTPSTIAEASFWPSPSGMTISGSGLQHWSRWRKAFQKLQETSEGQLCEVASHGLRIAEEKVEQAEARERQRQITGVF